MVEGLNLANLLCCIVIALNMENRVGNVTKVVHFLELISLHFSRTKSKGGKLTLGNLWSTKQLVASGGWQPVLGDGNKNMNRLVCYSLQGKRCCWRQQTWVQREGKQLVVEDMYVTPYKVKCIVVGNKHDFKGRENNWL
jgi:hypothetical protein